MNYTIQIAPEDCTGCALCVDVCPARNKKEPRRKAINMVPQPPIRMQERENWKFFLDLPEYDRRLVRLSSVKTNQLLQPLFEFSGACSGCGETPYIKLLTQLFGDRSSDRQCHRMLLDLRRQPADDSLYLQQRRPRPGLEQFSL